MLPKLLHSASPPPLSTHTHTHTHTHKPSIPTVYPHTGTCRPICEGTSTPLWKKAWEMENKHQKEHLGPCLSWAVSVQHFKHANYWHQFAVGPNGLWPVHSEWAHGYNPDWWSQSTEVWTGSLEGHMSLSTPDYQPMALHHSCGAQCWTLRHWSSITDVHCLLLLGFYQ